MRYRRFVLLLTMAFLPAICHADSLCPWINKATAFGVLGATEDSPKAKASDVSATACSFTYQAGNIMRELRVTVKQAKNPEQALHINMARCGSRGTPLRAIGNEAVMCATGKKGQSEEVFGRVRDNVFTISVSTSARKDPAMSREDLVQKAGIVAEQVSGNLF